MKLISWYNIVNWVSFPIEMVSSHLKLNWMIDLLVAYQLCREKNIEQEIKQCLRFIAAQCSSFMKPLWRKRVWQRVCAVGMCSGFMDPLWTLKPFLTHEKLTLVYWVGRLVFIDYTWYFKGKNTRLLKLIFLLVSLIFLVLNLNSSESCLFLRIYLVVLYITL